MKCPVCETVELSEREHGHHLNSQFCDACHGHWISGEALQSWRSSLSTKVASGKPHVPPYLVQSGRLLFCPHDGNILLKYRFGVSHDFYFDRCPECNGVWFDRHEWEIMRSRGLSIELSRILSEEWLAETVIHTELTEVVHRRENILQSLLNQEQYSEISRLRDWLDIHPNRRDVLSVLLSGRMEAPTDRTMNAAVS